MELAIYNQEGHDTGRKANLSDEVFAVVINEHALYLDVKQFLANRRQGTHKSKERSEVSGSTRKLHKQKGGGGSRIGDINSPVLVGGGRVFGPRPRDYRADHKTKEYVKFAKNLKVDGKKVLVVLADRNNDVYLSMRNVPGARLMTASDINTYAVLDNAALILTESSLELINKF